MDDKERYKPLLESYLVSKGIELHNAGRNKKSLLCPFHAETTPSAYLHTRDFRVHCYGCNANEDIFGCLEKLDGITGFKAQMEYLGEKHPNYKPIDRPAVEHKKIEVNTQYKLVDYETAKKIYNKKAISEHQSFLKFLDGYSIVKIWPYTDEKGFVQIVDVRFEKNGNKTVLSIWYDGNRLKSQNPPRCFYGLDKIDVKKPLLIVEGAKCADIAAKNLNNFSVTTWNQGTNNVDRVDWKKFVDIKTIYIFPDSDTPGKKAAKYIQSILPHALIVPQPSEAIEKYAEKKGVDIAESLEVLGIEKLTKYILSFGSTEKKRDKKKPYDKKPIEPITNNNKYPFTILGVSEHQIGYWIGVSNRLITCKMTSLTKIVLLNIAPRSWWNTMCGGERGISWEDAINITIQITNSVDFDAEKIVGRGGDINENEDLLYYDGAYFYGAPKNSKCVYVRKSRHDLGLDSTQLSETDRFEIDELTKHMSFASFSDRVRLLGWACLAPFAGCLPWRPAGLITGPSGSGKSTIVEKIVERISLPIICSGNDSTSAGIRQKINNDSCAVIIEEADPKNKQAKIIKEEQLALMRQSTSNNSPIVAKGSQSQSGAVEFRMKSMFLFVAVCPEIDLSTNENRIFRANIAKSPENDKIYSTKVRPKIDNVLSINKCRSLRAYIWSNLKQIISDTREIIGIIQDIAKKDMRYCLSEALLISAYFNVFNNAYKLQDEKFMTAYLNDFYSTNEVDPHRNEAEEIVDTLLDHIVHVEIERSKTERTLRQLIMGLMYKVVNPDNEKDGDISNNLSVSDYENIIATLAMYGLKVIDNGCLCISNNSGQISKILGMSKYNKTLYRHPRIVDKNIQQKIGGKNTRCISIKLSDVTKQLTDNVY